MVPWGVVQHGFFIFSITAFSGQEGYNGRRKLMSEQNKAVIYGVLLLMEFCTHVLMLTARSRAAEPCPFPAIGVERRGNALLMEKVREC